MRWPNPELTDPRRVLPGRPTPILTGCRHAVFGIDVGEVPAGSEIAYLALGCFWGAEKLYWTMPGVTNTAVGYAGGPTPNPTYAEVCSGRTNHAETVRVCFDPQLLGYAEVVRAFFEAHDPTQGMRQGNDVGTQYRSALFVTSPEQRATAEGLRDEYATAFARAGYPPLTTEIAEAGPFYFAEAEHQQYLAKNPGGYCPIHATGVTCRP